MAQATQERRLPKGRSNRFYTWLAVGLGLLAALLVFVTLQQGTSDEGASGGAGTVSVVVARQDIPARTKITADMLRTERVPSRAVLADVYRQPDALVGQVTRYPIAAREQIGAQRIAGATTSTVSKDGKTVVSDGLSFVVPQGKRALGVTVNEQSAVGGLIIAGDRVDVIVLFDKDLTGIEKAVTALQNIEVLSVAQAAEEVVPPPLEATPAVAAAAAKATDSRGTRPVVAKPQPQAKTVTLALSPAEAQVIALAEQHGKIWLSLRAYEDEQVVELRQADLLPLGVLPVERRPR